MKGEQSREIDAGDVQPVTADSFTIADCAGDTLSFVGVGSPSNETILVEMAMAGGRGEPLHDGRGSCDVYAVSMTKEQARDAARRLLMWADGSSDGKP